MIDNEFLRERAAIAAKLRLYAGAAGIIAHNMELCADRAGDSTDHAELMTIDKAYAAYSVTIAGATVSISIQPINHKPQEVRQ